jgi:hypothetical protein
MTLLATDEPGMGASESDRLHRDMTHVVSLRTMMCSAVEGNHGIAASVKFCCTDNWNGIYIAVSILFNDISTYRGRRTRSPRSWIKSENFFESVEDREDKRDARAADGTYAVKTSTEL